MPSCDGYLKGFLCSKHLILFFLKKGSSVLPRREAGCSFLLLAREEEEMWAVPALGLGSGAWKSTPALGTWGKQEQGSQKGALQGVGESYRRGRKGAKTEEGISEAGNRSHQEIFTWRFFLFFSKKGCFRFLFYISVLRSLLLSKRNFLIHLLLWDLMGTRILVGPVG